MTFSASSCVTLDSIRADSMRLLAGVGVIAHLHYRFASNHNLSHQKRSGTPEATNARGTDGGKRGSQRVIMFFTSLAFIGLLVVPALDRRFGWSTVSQYVGNLATPQLIHCFQCQFEAVRIDMHYSLERAINVGDGNQHQGD